MYRICTETRIIFVNFLSGTILFINFLNAGDLNSIDETFHPMSCIAHCCQDSKGNNSQWASLCLCVEANVIMTDASAFSLQRPNVLTLKGI